MLSQSQMHDELPWGSCKKAEMADVYTRDLTMLDSPKAAGDGIRQWVRFPRWRTSADSALLKLNGMAR
jgi:hypothetical protein